MADQMSAEEIVAALVAKGVPKERAQLVARSNVGSNLPNAIRAAPIAAPVSLPVRITLPWSALCSDNDRERAIVWDNRGTPSPKKAMTQRYKDARDKVISAARRVMGEAAPLDMPLSLVARVFVPAQRRVDVVNFAKGVHDALNNVVYTDDHLLHDVRWVRAGADVDAPRVEIEINLLAESSLKSYTSA